MPAKGLDPFCHGLLTLRYSREHRQNMTANRCDFAQIADFPLHGEWSDR